MLAALEILAMLKPFSTNFFTSEKIQTDEVSRMMNKRSERRSDGRSVFDWSLAQLAKAGLTAQGQGLRLEYLLQRMEINN